MGEELSEAGPWPYQETSASGQVFEFRVWAELTEQSRGQLHVFLPLSDRGIDALVHRLSDGAYIPVQAKGRSTMKNDYVHLVVPAGSIADDSVLVVSGLTVDGGLGPAMLVVPAADFRRLAESSLDQGRPIYAMAFPMSLRSQSKWAPWLVSSNGLVERFGLSPSQSAPALAGELVTFESSDLGFLGESEVVRRLAESEDLNLFRPFPDSETAEILVRHRVNRRVIGLQVKTVTVDAVHTRPSVDIRISSFRPAPTTYFTVLVWLSDEGRFHEFFLMFPSERLIEFAREDKGHFKFELRPGSTSPGPLKSFRRPLAELRMATELLLAEAADPAPGVRP
ncbi:MAG: hypothetical protein ACHQ0J_13125 [Candidatus Dormibacterales bacterium]